MDFCFHSEATRCPLESVKTLFLELWSPFQPNKLFRLESHQTVWNVHEQTTCSRVPRQQQQQEFRIRFYPDQSTQVIQLCSHFPSPLVIKSTDVVFVIYLYARQPRDPSIGDMVEIIRHVSTVALFGEDFLSSSAVIKTSRHQPENKWLGQIRDHAQLHFNLRLNQDTRIERQKQSASEYWDDALRTIWNGFHQWEINWMGDEQSPRVLAVTPFTIPVHGIPAPMNAKGNDYMFAVSKGLSTQSLWYQPFDVVTEDWIVRTITDVLHLRGATVNEFMQVSFSKPTNDHDREAFQKCLSDCVKLVTLYTTTWPYTTDHVLVNDGIAVKSVTVDVLEPAKLKPGDCEDSAATAVQIATEILSLKKPNHPIIRRIRQFLAILGVPCGLSGSIPADTTVELDLPCHMFAGFIPVPMYAKLFGVEFDMVAFQELFEFSGAPYIPLHAAIMEGTILSSPFYSTRVHVTKEKAMKTEMIRQLLCSTAGEIADEVAWRNYCLPLPFTFSGSMGVQLHHSVYRIFNQAAKQFNLPTSLTQSYVLMDNKNIGIPVSELFKRYESIDDLPRTWNVQVSTPMSEDVYLVEQEVIRQFQRPNIPIQYELGDFNRGTDGDMASEQEFQRFLAKHAAPVNKDRNRRIVMFAWRLTGQTRLLIEDIQERIQATGVSVQRLGHGYAFHFNI